MEDVFQEPRSANTIPVNTTSNPKQENCDSAGAWRLLSHCCGMRDRQFPCSEYTNSIFNNFFLWPHCAACGILVPWPGIEPVPLQWKPRVLITGRPGKSLFNNFECGLQFASPYLIFPQHPWHLSGYVHHQPGPHHTVSQHVIKVGPQTFILFITLVLSHLKMGPNWKRLDFKLLIVCFCLLSVIYSRPLYPCGLPGSAASHCQGDMFCPAQPGLLTSVLGPGVSLSKGQEPCSADPALCLTSSSYCLDL